MSIQYWKSFHATKKKAADSKTEMIMPEDTYPLDNLMRWMDIVGGICVVKRCEAQQQ